MKILILGGSGVLSTDFTKLCLNNGNEVWMLNRGNRINFIDNRAHLIVADLRSDSTDNIITKLGKTEYDVVVDFLSFTVEQMKKSLKFISGKFNQYIFISSATVYKVKNCNEIISENVTQIGNDKWDYALNKSLCEKYLKDTNIKYTIVRPYVTFGDSRIPFQIIPDKFYYTLLERIKEEKPVLLFEEGKAICTLTHTSDFAQVLYLLLNNSNAFHEDFHITSNERQSWKDVYMKICKIMNVKPNYISATFDEIKKYMPEYYNVLAGDKGRSMIFNNDKVMKVVGGYNFSIPLEKGLSQSIKYFKSHYEMQGIDFKWEGEVDFLIANIANEKLKILKMKNKYSKNRYIYYIMKIKPLRGCYKLAKLIKRNI